MKDVKKNILTIANTLLMQAALLFPILCILVMLGIIAWFYKSLPPQIPLYYSRPWGDEQLAAPIFLLLLPLGSLLWYGAGLLLIGKRMYVYRVFSQIVLLIQAISSTLALMVIINILRLII